jgi:hypothetical protein
MDGLRMLTRNSEYRLFARSLSGSIELEGQRINSCRLPHNMEVSGARKKGDKVKSSNPTSIKIVAEK